MTLPLLGQGRPCCSLWSGLESMLGKHRSRLHLDTYHARQGEVLFLPTFPQTWHLLSLQTWERLVRAAQASLLAEQAPWVRCFKCP